MAKPPSDELEGRLRQAWEVARRRWPRVDLPAEVFIRYVVQRLDEASEERSLEAQIEELDLEGLSLSCACVNGVPMAIEMFEQDYLAKLPSVIRDPRLSAAHLDELCQQVRMHLLVRTPEGELRLAQYKGRSALLSWIRVVATHMVRKLVPTSRETPDGNSIIDEIAKLPAPGTDAEGEIIKRRYHHEFLQALREAFAALSSEERYLLRLHFVDKLPTTKMAPLFGKNQSTISRWITKALEQIYEETKHILQERLGVSSQEFTSLTNAIKSRFDMSISQLLRVDQKAEDEED